MALTLTLSFRGSIDNPECYIDATHSTLANIGTVSYFFANDNTIPLTPDMVGVAR